MKVDPDEGLRALGHRSAADRRSLPQPCLLHGEPITQQQWADQLNGALGTEAEYRALSGSVDA